jgi:peptide/nickel transport system substrate-binding protein
LRRLAVLTLIAISLLACASPAPSGPRGDAGSASSPRETGRTLVAGTRVEPGTVATRPVRLTGVALYLSKRLFNAELANLDDRGVPLPYLAVALPELNTDSWRVFPDGRMETTWRLKPNLTWHDGRPLTAEDFVFSWRVYTTPELGESNAPPFHAIEEVLAPDERTVLIRWAQPYPDAGKLAGQNRELPPLPRHILESAFTQMDLDGFANHLYWTREYLGLGPYRLDRWEPGSFFEAAPFDGHVLGRPKIARIKVVFISDANTALANMLSGEVHLSADTSLRLEQAATLKQDWGPRHAGSILLHPNQWRATVFQFRPEYAAPRAILDQRARKALAHAVERQAINDSLYQGDGVFSDFIVSPSSEWGRDIENAVVKYPYDLRRSEQLMLEAGFARGGDGTFLHPGEGRFTAEVRTNAAADNEAEMAIIASEWRKAGFDARESALPAALAQDGEARSTFSAMFINNTGAGEATLLGFSSSSISSAANRWRGNNRGGWANAEYDRLLEAFTTTLDRDERGRQMAQMARIFTEDVAAISLFFRTQPWAHVAALTGPRVVAPESNMAWNIHEWEFR